MPEYHKNREHMATPEQEAEARAREKERKRMTSAQRRAEAVKIADEYVKQPPPNPSTDVPG